MENLEQIITKQNNIREKINEYNRDFELYNKTYIEKFTELKTLKNELKYEKNSVQKDDDKIKILHFKIQSMSIEISSMANKVKEIQTNINDMKLEQEQLKEELLENPEVKIAVYAEEKRRVQELKDAKILEKREIDTLLKNNPKDISEIPNNIAEKISKDSLFQKYDSQISNFTELLNNSSNPRAKSSLENKIKTLEKEKEEFLISKIKEIASEYQNSIHIYEKELQTLAVKEAKVILDRHNGVYNGTSKVKDQKVFDDSKDNTSKTNDEKETNQSNNKNESQQTNEKSKDENDENTNNSKDDINDPSDNSDFKSKIMEEDIKNLPKKIGFFDKFKEKFSKVKEWLKDQFDNFKLTTVPMPEKNAKNDGPEVNTDEKGNTENKKDETETQNKEEKKQEKEKEKEQQEQKQNDDSSKNMNNTDTENNKEEENSKETEDNREYTNSNYTQKEILDNEDIRKKIEDYMNNLEKKQKNNSNKEKENSTRESKEKEEI